MLWISLLVHDIALAALAIAIHFQCLFVAAQVTLPKYVNDWHLSVKADN